MSTAAAAAGGDFDSLLLLQPTASDGVICDLGEWLDEADLLLVMGRSDRVGSDRLGACRLGPGLLGTDRLG